MPLTPHIESHFTASAIVRDVVIGMSDGLTVPFALAAGLSGAVAQAGIVVTAGLAEIAAGSIAMGLGGYLAAKSDAEHYAAEKRREEHDDFDEGAEEDDRQDQQLQRQQEQFQREERGANEHGAIPPHRTYGAHAAGLRHVRPVGPT